MNDKFVGEDIWLRHENEWREIGRNDASGGIRPATVRAGSSAEPMNGWRSERLSQQAAD